MALKRDATDRQRVATWYGTADDLRDLVGYIHTLQDKIRERAKQKLEASEDHLRMEADVYQKAWIEQLVRVTEFDGTKVTGLLDEILAEIPVSRISEIDYSYPSYYEDEPDCRIGLYFFIQGGLAIQSSGTDRALARSTASLVAERASTRSPRWSWLIAKPLGMICFGVVVWVVLSALGLGLLHHFAPHAKASSRLSVVTLAFSLGSFSVFLLVSLPKLFPKFQLLPDGDVSRAGRILGWTAGLLASAVVAAIFTLATT